MKFCEKYEVDMLKIIIIIIIGYILNNFKFPKEFSIAPHFLSQMLWQMLSSFHLYTWTTKGEEFYASK
jgi:hypothetical protein